MKQLIILKKYSQIDISMIKELIKGIVMMNLMI
jgi:hypothetical protein